MTVAACLPMRPASKERGPDRDAVDEADLAVRRGHFPFEDGACDGFACGLLSPQPGNASGFRDRLRRHRDRGVFPGLLETDMDFDGSGHNGPFVFVCASVLQRPGA